MKNPRALLLVVVALCSCSRLGYFAHLGRGSLSLLTRAEPVEKLLRQDATPEELADRLRLARQILAFAETHLALPVGKKYGKYVDLGRDYVVWTVVAAPEFSLEPETWCFPVAGCVGYRGFFSPDKAEAFGRKLERGGFDVSVGGVAAFSFLGWFEEPLLNTFVFDPERRLAGLLFHELAHGVVYVKGDTVFNESFASAVERAGVRRWLERAGESQEVELAVAEYQRSLEALDRAYQVIRRKREQLEELYAEPVDSAAATPTEAGGPGMSSTEKRRRKAALFAEMRRELAMADGNRETGFASWGERDLDNADLASAAFYLEALPAFEDLLQAVGEDLGRFYAAVECLAALEVSERTRNLASRTWSGCLSDRRLGRAAGPGLELAAPGQVHPVRSAEAPDSGGDSNLPAFSDHHLNGSRTPLAQSAADRAGGFVEVLQHLATVSFQ